MIDGRPTFLLTNDDGIDSEGLKILEDFLNKFGTVVVVAPATHQSSKSTSVSINVTEGMKVDQIDELTYAVHGTPADCVAWALHVLDIKIDVVVSGCNRGFNIGTDTIYSGTVGACHQAMMLGYRSVAFSADLEYKNLKENLDSIYDYLLKNKLISRNYILNINIPNTDEVKGIKITMVSPQSQTIFFKNEGNTYFYNGRKCYYTKIKNTDYVEIMNGYVSISPLKCTSFDEGAYRKLRKLNHEDNN